MQVIEHMMAVLTSTKKVCQALYRPNFKGSSWNAMFHNIQTGVRSISVTLKAYAIAKCRSASLYKGANTQLTHTDYFYWFQMPSSTKTVHSIYMLFRVLSESAKSTWLAQSATARIESSSHLVATISLHACCVHSYECNVGDTA